MSSAISTTPAKRTLLVAWDGVDWELVSPLLEAGKLPNLQKLLDRGICGKLAGFSPIVPAALWTSLATGYRPEIHGVLGDLKSDLDSQTISPFGSANRRVPAIWKLLQDEGLKTHVFGWPSSHPAENVNGYSVSNLFSQAEGQPDNWLLPQGSIHPREATEIFSELRLHPAEFAAADLEPMISGVSAINLREDVRPWNLATHLAATVSINAAATYALQQGPWDFAAVFFGAAGAIARDFLAYHPPQMTGVSDEDFKKYECVMTGTLALHDQILGVLASLAGENALVILCSAFGYPSSKDRVIPEKGEHTLHVESRRFPGLLILSGPQTRKDEWLFNPHLLDIAPTILAAMGFLLPRELKGRALLDAFTTPLSLKFCEPQTEIPPVAGWKLPVKPIEAKSLAVWENGAQNLFHLALCEMNARRFAEAEVILKEVCRAQPERLRPALDLISCLLALGRIDEAEILLEEVATRPNGGLKLRGGMRPKFLPEYDLIRGLLALARNQPEVALEHLQRGAKASGQLPAYHSHLGNVYLRLKMWREAKNVFRKSVKTDSSNPQAHFGLAIACYWLRDFTRSAEAALDATALAPQFGPGHLLVGLSLARLGETEAAITALQTAISQNTDPVRAHRVLSRLYRRRSETKGLADLHLRAGRARKKYEYPSFEGRD